MCIIHAEIYANLDYEKEKKNSKDCDDQESGSLC